MTASFLRRLVLASVVLAWPLLSFSQNTLLIETDGDVGFGEDCPDDVEEVTFADWFIAFECSEAGDTLRFGPGTHRIDNASVGVDQNAVDIPHSLVIEGAGREQTRLDASATSTGLRIGVDAPQLEVTFRQLELFGLLGLRPIWIADSEVVMQEMDLVSNTANDDILRLEDESVLTLEGVDVIGSSGDNPNLFGATHDSSVTFRGGRVSGNEIGRLIRAEVNSDVKLRDVSVFDNTMFSDEKILISNSARLELVNVSLIDNLLDSGRSRFLSFQDTASVRLAYTTIAFNTYVNQAQDERPLAITKGLDVSLQLSHVLIAEQEARDCNGSSTGVTSLGHNVSSSQSDELNTCEDWLDDPTDSIDLPANALAPADTGGDVPTVPVSVESPAIDGAAACLDFDGQLIEDDIRGFPRPAERPCTAGSWQYYPSRGVTGIVYGRQDTAVRYAAVLDGGVYRSDDGGENWTETATGLGNLVVDLAVDPDNDDRVLAAIFGQGVQLSTDGGETWSEASDGLEGDARKVHDLQFDPVDANVVFAASDDGLYRSEDGGESWAPFGSGLPD